MRGLIAIFVYAFLSLSVSLLFAQDPALRASSIRDASVYFSPKNGDMYVPAKTTITLRLAQDILRNAAASNFSFTVRGEFSGAHTGKVVIADDDRTVIFKPDVPFNLNELVTVNISFIGEDNIAPVNYTFRTTEMSEAERDQVLYEIRQKEQEKPNPPQDFSEKNQNEILYFPDNDSFPCFLRVDTLKNPAPGNIFFSAVNLFNGSFSFIGILGNSGNPGFNQNIPKGCENFKALPDNTFSYFAQTPPPKGGMDIGIINRIDSKGKLIETYQCGNGYTTDYHDFQLLPDDHALVVSFDPEYVDMTKIISDTNAKSYAKVTGAIIQEIDKDKNVVFQWRSWDHVKITDATHESLTSSIIDYVHMNTAFMDTDGNIIASFRHMDEVTKISRKDTSTIWRFGGKNNQFAFLGDTLKFSHQHNPARIANGHLTLWDNGNYRLIDTLLHGIDTIINRPFSRAVEFDLDETHHTATTVWEFRDVPVSSAGGDVQRLENGNTFMDFGLQTSPNMMEITPQGEKVFQLTLDFGAWCYRAYKFPLIVNAVSQTSSMNPLAITGIYPNPAQNQTTVSFSVKDPGMMQIDLLDVLGHSVRSIKEKLSGTAPIYSTNLDLHNLTAGTYYCKLTQGSNTDTKMVVVQK